MAIMGIVSKNGGQHRFELFPWHIRDPNAISGWRHVNRRIQTNTEDIDGHSTTQNPSSVIRDNFAMAFHLKNSIAIGIVPYNAL